MAEPLINSYAAAPPRLLDLVRDAIRRRHYSYRTEQTYLHWIKRYIWFHGKRHPREMGAAAGLAEPLRSHLARVRTMHERDLAEGFGEAEMLLALGRKYPNAGRQWAWQFVFPSRKRSVDPRSGAERRHHVYDDVLPRAIGEAARAAGWSTRTC